MDFGPGSRALVVALVRGGSLKVRRAEIVGRQLGDYAGSLGRAPTPGELEAWLEDHAQTEELTASEAQLAAALDEHLAAPKAPPTSVRDEALERQIMKAQTDADRIAAVSVYADWLHERNDPFGEQLALGLASEAAGDDRFERWVHAHRQEVFGPHAPGELARLDFTWRHGAIDYITYTHDGGDTTTSPEMWTQVLSARSCSLLRQLWFYRWVPEASDAAIAAAAPRWLADVSIGDLKLRNVKEARRGILPHAPAGVAKLPLETIELRAAHVELFPDTFSPTLEYVRLLVHGEIRIAGEGPLALPNLRSIHLTATPAIAELLPRFAMPRLGRLTVQTYRENGELVDHSALFAGHPCYAGIED